MIKVRINIKSTYGCGDDVVFSDVLLPAIPQKGEYIHLGEKVLEDLHKKARTEENIKRFAPKWMYGKSFYCSCPNISDFPNLGFDDAHIISKVEYNTDEDFVYLEIDSI